MARRMSDRTFDTAVSVSVLSTVSLFVFLKHTAQYNRSNVRLMTTVGRHVCVQLLLPSYSTGRTV